MRRNRRADRARTAGFAEEAPWTTAKQEIVSLAQRVLGSGIADLPTGERGVVLEIHSLHQKIDRTSAVLDQVADGAAPGSGD